MTDFELWTDVPARVRQGQGKRQMARELGLDRKTVKRILTQERPAPYRRTVSRPTVVTPYLDLMHRRAAEVDYHADRIVHELQAQGYPGGDEMVKLAVRPLTMDQQLATLVACHQHAFDWFGGLTEELLDDTPKTVVLKRNWEGRAIEWHPQFWDFARYDGFTPRLCRPYRAQTKGKLESGVKYVKRSFVLGRPVSSWDALNPMAHEWVMRVADQRVFQVTTRRMAGLAGTMRPPLPTTCWHPLGALHNKPRLHNKV